MLRAVIIVGALGAAPGALAQAYPAKPIHIVTQFAAGASGDANMRAIAQPLAESLGQPVVVDNKPGGGGVVAAAFVAKSPPDGYAILGASSATQVVHGWITKNVPFDPIRDFTPITLLSKPTVVIIAHPSVKAANLSELLEFAKRNPRKVFYGTSGVGSEHHLSGEQIRQLTGVDIVHVPYKATAQALVDVVSGQLPVSFSIYAAAVHFIQDGKVRALAVVREKRVAFLPDLQSVAEAVPGFEEPPMWTGLFGPAGLPDPIVRRLNAEAVKALQSAAIQKMYAARGSEAVGSSPEAFAAQIRKEVALVGRIVKEAGIERR